MRSNNGVGGDKFRVCIDKWKREWGGVFFITVKTKKRKK
jgi:hypothetical protein